jgi:hypothetical protein
MNLMNMGEFGGPIETAPRDGRYIIAFCGGVVGSFAYFENGRWLAPESVDRLELGVHPIEPTGWIASSRARAH